jgi:hypothetical protein
MYGWDSYASDPTVRNLGTYKEPWKLADKAMVTLKPG